MEEERAQKTGRSTLTRMDGFLEMEKH